MTTESRSRIAEALAVVRALSAEERIAFDYAVGDEAPADKPKRGRPQGSRNKPQPHVEAGTVYVCDHGVPRGEACIKCWDEKP